MTDERNGPLDEIGSELANLYVARHQILGGLSREGVLLAIEDIIVNLVGSEELAIFETDAARGRLTLLASTGIEPGPFQEIYIGDGAIGRAAATGERLIRQEGGSLTEDGDAALTACIAGTNARRRSSAVDIRRSRINSARLAPSTNSIAMNGPTTGSSPTS